MTTPNEASDLLAAGRGFDPDTRWAAHYNNAAERLYPGVVVLGAAQDAACIAEADEALAADEANR